MKSTKSLLILTLTLNLLIFDVSQAQTAVAALPNPVSETSEVRMAAFEKVWNTINERHYDPAFGGVDWQKIRKTYEPLAKAAKNNDELHGVLRRMLGELKLSHFGIYPRSMDLEQTQQLSGTVGIGIIFLDGLPVVGRVAPASVAESAGVKQGFVINKIEGDDRAAIIKSVEATFAGRTISPQMRSIYRERFFEARLNGKPGTKVRIEMLDARDRVQIFELNRESFKGQMSQALGNFPPQAVVFESRRLADDIGYLRFNIWVMPQMAKIREAMREFGSSKGIVIDLRGNPGGIGGMATGFAGLLTKDQFSLRTMKTRESVMNFISYPQENPFLGKIAILTDHGTGSTSEVFAAGMQESGRAKIIGSTTAGADRGAKRNENKTSIGDAVSYVENLAVKAPERKFTLIYVSDGVNTLDTINFDDRKALAARFSESTVSFSALSFDILGSYSAAAKIINPLAYVFGASVTGSANYLAEQTGGVA
ncbi:MAG: S41 family peptidase, partial [Blastocatellia bacterium]